MNFQQLFGTRLPLIQAPMAGVQGSALAAAVCRAGALGSLPGAMLDADTLRRELTALRSQVPGPFNVNFFCHTPPEPDAAREVVGSSRVDLQACKLEYSIVSPK